MTYDIQEASIADARPFFLYQFVNGAGSNYFTSGPRQVTVDAHDWLPSSIGHDNMKQNGNIETQDLKFTFPLSSTFASDLLEPATSNTIITVFRLHASDLALETRTFWKGRVAGARQEGNEIVVSGETIFTSLRRTGCTARVQRSCIHAVYFPGCNVDKDDHAVSATITAISGLNLTCPQANDIDNVRYKGGMMDFGGVWGFFENHAGTLLTLVSPVVGLQEYLDANPTAAVTIYPGCDRSAPICISRFDNIVNRLAFDHRPPNNPFTVGIL